MHKVVTWIRILLIVFTGFLVSFSMLVCLPFDPKGTAYFGLGSLWARVVLRICKISVTVIGGEIIDKTKSYIYVSNHASMFDIPVILAYFPHTRIMFKKELSYIPFWGWALRFGYHIMVDRAKSSEAMKSIDRSVEAIKKGGSVILFAEGTRSADGKLLPFKRGAFTLAARSGVPIIPVTINGSFKVLPKNSIDIRPSDLELIVEPPVATDHVSTREQEIQLMQHVRGLIEKNYKEQI